MNRSIIFLAILGILSSSCREKHAHDDHDEHEGHAESETEHQRTVKLSVEAVKAANLGFGVAEAKPLTGALTASARLTLTQDGTSRVSARVPGRVELVKVALGEKVKRGQVLAIIESAELGQARADYLVAQTKRDVAATTHAREKQLVEKGISAEKELREAESVLAVSKGEIDAADARLHAFGLTEAEIKSLKSNEHYSSEFPIRAPIDGTVIELKASRGLNIDGTTQLFMIGELTTLWAIIDIFEQQLPSVHAGQLVDISVVAVPNATFEGRVDYIADLVEEKSRTIEVRVVVPNTYGRLKPGMFATASLRTERAADGGGLGTAVVVPREAVQKVGGENVVFTPLDAQTFQAIEIELGETTANDAVVRSGLEAGKKVVTRGAFILKSELSKESMGEGHSH